MAVEFKDYYKILGVPRTATDEDIRKAFRKLARQYHPDVAKDKKLAEEKFKEINEANEVLSNPETRRKYDELGADWKHGGAFRPPPGGQGRTRGRRPSGGAEGFEFSFDGTGFSDFFEQFFGSKAGGQARSAGFRGMADEEEDLPQRGRDLEAGLMVTLEEIITGSVRPISLRRQVTCDSCQGTGHRQHQRCPVCEGSGQVSRTEKYKVKIPAGVTEGQRLRISGRGEQGIGRGPAGDLYLRVRLAQHPDFHVEDRGLRCDVALAPWEAVLGTTVSVSTLDGQVQIKIPPGTQNGQRLRLRGHGLPTAEGVRGDLYVVTRIQLPEHLSDHERELWQKLARESGFRPRE